MTGDEVQASCGLVQWRIQEDFEGGRKGVAEWHARSRNILPLHVRAAFWVEMVYCTLRKSQSSVIYMSIFLVVQREVLRYHEAYPSLHNRTSETMSLLYKMVFYLQY